METIVGFVAGYLVGTREGKDGLERMRSSWHSIRTSPESDLHELRDDPVRRMILPSDGSGLRGWRAGWGEVIWPARRAWNWCPGLCSCGRRTR